MGRGIVNNSVNKQMLKKGGKKHLIKAQKGIYKGDPGFTITPDKPFKGDPKFVITPSDSAMKKYKPKTSKDGYVQYQKGGNTSDRSFKLFGKNYDKTLTRTQNDDGSVTKNKVKTVSKDGELLKKKELSRTTDNGYLTKSNRTKTEYMGDGDSKTKSRSWNLPTNTKAYMDANYKKGGSTKVKKYQDGGPTTLGKTMTRSVKIKKSGEEKEISDKRYDRIKNRITNKAGSTGISGQKIEDGITTTDEGFRNKSGRKAIGRRTVSYKKGGSIKSKSKNK